jgi:hypothetical protein
MKRRIFMGALVGGAAAASLNVPRVKATEVRPPGRAWATMADFHNRLEAEYGKHSVERYEVPRVFADACFHEWSPAAGPIPDGGLDWGRTRLSWKGVRMLRQNDECTARDTSQDWFPAIHGYIKGKRTPEVCTLDYRRNPGADL